MNDIERNKRTQAYVDAKIAEEKENAQKNAPMNTWMRGYIQKKNEHSAKLMQLFIDNAKQHQGK